MELYIFVAIIFLASILQGITGFGFALIAAPLALLFVDKTTNVISLTLISLALNSFLLWHIRRALNKRLLVILSITSLVGLPLGFLLLTSVDIQGIRILAGSLSVIFALLLFGKLIKFPRTGIATSIAGILAGTLHTSISMSGPPVVLLAAGQETDKDESRRTFAAFFLFMSVVSILLFAATGTLEEKGIMYGLYSFPAAFIGGWIGSLLSKKVSPEQFRILTLVLICLTGCTAVYAGFSGA